MLAKLNRFHGNQAVRRVYRYGEAVRGRVMSLHIYKGTGNQRHLRAGVVVSRKVNKSAVVRNRIRRRVYEQVRNKLPEVKVQADLLFTVYQTEAASMPADQLASEVERLLKQAHILG